MALPASQDELPSRSMGDSFLWARIPLGTDTKLREKYVNFHNLVRFGRLLEDLDTMSGNLLVIVLAHSSYKHVVLQMSERSVSWTTSR